MQIIIRKKLILFNIFGGLLESPFWLLDGFFAPKFWEVAGTYESSFFSKVHAP